MDWELYMLYPGEMGTSSVIKFQGSVAAHFKPTKEVMDDLIAQVATALYNQWKL